MKPIRTADGAKMQPSSLTNVETNQPFAVAARYFRHLVAVECASLGLLAATALLWGSTSAYDLWIRFGVSPGGLAVLFRALCPRRHALAAAFTSVVPGYSL
jgi:hypothetical protein